MESKIKREKFMGLDCEGKIFRERGFFYLEKEEIDLWVWEKIIKVNEFLKKEFRWKLGNGDNISFWIYIWIDDKSIKKIFEKYKNDVNG